MRAGILVVVVVVVVVAISAKTPCFSTFNNFFFCHWRLCFEAE